MSPAKGGETSAHLSPPASDGQSGYQRGSSYRRKKTYEKPWLPAQTVVQGAGCQTSDRSRSEMKSQLRGSEDRHQEPPLVDRHGYEDNTRNSGPDIHGPSNRDSMPGNILANTQNKSESMGNVKQSIDESMLRGLRTDPITGEQLSNLESKSPRLVTEQGPGGPRGRGQQRREADVTPATAQNDESMFKGYAGGPEVVTDRLLGPSNAASSTLHVKSAVKPEQAFITSQQPAFGRSQYCHQCSQIYLESNDLRIKDIGSLKYQAIVNFQDNIYNGFEAHTICKKCGKQGKITFNQRDGTKSIIDYSKGADASRLFDQFRRTEHDFRLAKSPLALVDEENILKEQVEIKLKRDFFKYIQENTPNENALLLPSPRQQKSILKGRRQNDSPSRQQKIQLAIDGKRKYQTDLEGIMAGGEGQGTSQRYSEPDESIPALPESNHQGPGGMQLNFASPPGRRVHTIKQSTFELRLKSNQAEELSPMLSSPRPLHRVDKEVASTNMGFYNRSGVKRSNAAFSLHTNHFDDARTSPLGATPNNRGTNQVQKESHTKLSPKLGPDTLVGVSKELMSLQPAAALSHGSDAMEPQGWRTALKDVCDATKPEATERILTVASPPSVAAAPRPNYVKINVRYPSTKKKQVVNRHSSNYMKINEDLDTNKSSIRDAIKNISQIEEEFTAKKKSSGQEETLSDVATPHVDSLHQSGQGAPASHAESMVQAQMKYVVLDMVDVQAGATRDRVAERVKSQSPLGYVNVHQKFMVTNPLQASHSKKQKMPFNHYAHPQTSQYPLGPPGGVVADNQGLADHIIEDEEAKRRALISEKELEKIVFKVVDDIKQHNELLRQAFRPNPALHEHYVRMKVANERFRNTRTKDQIRRQIEGTNTLVNSLEQSLQEQTRALEEADQPLSTEQDQPYLTYRTLNQAEPFKQVSAALQEGRHARSKRVTPEILSSRANAKSPRAAIQKDLASLQIPKSIVECTINQAFGADENSPQTMLNHVCEPKEASAGHKPPGVRAPSPVKLRSTFFFGTSRPQDKDAKVNEYPNNLMKALNIASANESSQRTETYRSPMMLKPILTKSNAGLPAARQTELSARGADDQKDQFSGRQSSREGVTRSIPLSTNSKIHTSIHHMTNADGGAAPYVLENYNSQQNIQSSGQVELKAGENAVAVEVTGMSNASLPLNSQRGGDGSPPGGNLRVEDPKVTSIYFLNAKDAGPRTLNSSPRAANQMQNSDLVTDLAGNVNHTYALGQNVGNPPLQFQIHLNGKAEARQVAGSRGDGPNIRDLGREALSIQGSKKLISRIAIGSAINQQLWKWYQPDSAAMPPALLHEMKTQKALQQKQQHITRLVDGFQDQFSYLKAKRAIKKFYIKDEDYDELELYERYYSYLTEFDHLDLSISGNQVQMKDPQEAHIRLQQRQRHINQLDHPGRHKARQTVSLETHGRGQAAQKNTKISLNISQARSKGGDASALAIYPQVTQSAHNPSGQQQGSSSPLDGGRGSIALQSSIFDQKPSLQNSCGLHETKGSVNQNDQTHLDGDPETNEMENTDGEFDEDMQDEIAGVSVQLKTSRTRNGAARQHDKDDFFIDDIQTFHNFVLDMNRCRFKKFRHSNLLLDDSIYLNQPQLYNKKVQMDEHYRQRKQDNIDHTVGLLKEKLSGKVQKILQDTQKNRDKLIENGNLIPDEHDEEKKEKKRQEKLGKARDSLFRSQGPEEEPGRYRADFSTFIERQRDYQEQDGEVEFDPRRNNDSIISTNRKSVRVKTKSTFEADKGGSILQDSLIGRDFIRMSKALDFSKTSGAVAKSEVVSFTQQNKYLDKIKDSFRHKNYHMKQAGPFGVMDFGSLCSKTRQSMNATVQHPTEEQSLISDNTYASQDQQLRDSQIHSLLFNKKKGNLNKEHIARGLDTIKIQKRLMTSEQIYSNKARRDQLEKLMNGSTMPNEKGARKILPDPKASFKLGPLQYKLGYERDNLRTSVDQTRVATLGRQGRNHLVAKSLQFKGSNDLQNAQHKTLVPILRQSQDAAKINFNDEVSKFMEKGIRRYGDSVELPSL